MNTKIIIYVVASFLCLIAAPLLFFGGKNENTGLMIFGLALFFIGMGMPPVQRFFTRK